MCFSATFYSPGLGCEASHHFFVVFCLVFLYDDISLPALLFRVQEPLLCFDFCHLKLKVSNCSIISPFVLDLCVFLCISSPELLEGCMRCLVQGLYTILRIKLTKMYRVSCQKRPCTKFGTANKKPFLGAFGKLRNAAARFMSVSTHGTARLSLDGFS